MVVQSTIDSAMGENVRRKLPDVPSSEEPTCSVRTVPYDFRIFTNLEYMPASPRPARILAAKYMNSPRPAILGALFDPG